MYLPEGRAVMECELGMRPGLTVKGEEYLYQHCQSFVHHSDFSFLVCLTVRILILLKTIGCTSDTYFIYFISLIHHLSHPFTDAFFFVSSKVNYKESYKQRYNMCLMRDSKLQPLFCKGALSTELTKPTILPIITLFFLWSARTDIKWNSISF